VVKSVITRIVQNADSVEELVLSPQNAPETDKTGISKTSVHSAQDRETAT